MEYVEKLKTNYYIPIDTTGLDFDDVVNLIKCKLDFDSKTEEKEFYLSENGVNGSKLIQ